ncbi:NAD(P)-dependent oxidoreductase [Candidatus Pelagibacter sp.]|nr:NAD(P)-dependent oxidoreductase [Candidatus Pelagibacter sp.]
MNYLITGGSGYIGSELVKKLIHENENVINIDVLKSDNLKSKNFQFDILDENKLENVFKNNKIDIIIHNLAKVPLTKNKNVFKKVNINSTQNILKLFKKYKVKKLIFVSSSAVYGIPDNCPISENTTRNPVEPYGESKKISEDLCFDYIQNGGNITIIRPRTVIGLNRFGIFSFLFDWIKNDLPVPVMSGGKNYYQFLDVRDLSSAIYLASKSSYTGSLNVGASDVKRIIDIINFLKEEFNSKSKIKDLNNSLLLKAGFYMQRAGLIPLHDYHFKVYGSDIYFDISNIKKKLNWEPQYSTFESFKNSYLFFLKEDIDNKNKSIHQKKIKNLLLKYSTLFL